MYPHLKCSRCLAQIWPSRPTVPFINHLWARCDGSGVATEVKALSASEPSLTLLLLRMLSSSSISYSILGLITFLSNHSSLSLYLSWLFFQSITISALMPHGTNCQLFFWRNHMLSVVATSVLPVWWAVSISFFESWVLFQAGVAPCTTPFHSQAPGFLSLPLLFAMMSTHFISWVLLLLRLAEESVSGIAENKHIDPLDF